MTTIKRLLAAAVLLAALTTGRADAHGVHGYGWYRITGYFPTGNLTATGNPTYYGELAVDPNVIPLCSWVHIEGLGNFRAFDTGSLVYGRHLDLLVYNWSQAYRVQGNGYRKAYWWRGPACRH